MTPRSYYDDHLNLLLVDDDLCILQVLSRLLQGDGHTVGLALNGPNALDQFQSGAWDAVLTDRAMPGMDGEALAREIKRLSPATPVIMVTGLDRAEGGPNVDAVLGKPFSRAAIAAVITRTLAKGAQEPAPATRDTISAAA